MSFDERAQDWDASGRRQALAEAVYRAIVSRISLREGMRLLDFGAGTGLLTRRLLPHVGHITAVDTSEGMLRKLREAVGEESGVETRKMDILDYRPGHRFDGIVSSMTMHHIEKTDALLRHLHGLLVPGGFLAVADLAPEDGSFHDHGNEGVHHFGFDEATLLETAQRVGFDDISYTIIHTVTKEPDRHYPIFLLTATRPCHVSSRSSSPPPSRSRS
ncbi:class I SAM-dependent methyltransferase [Hydrogenimonas sp.]